MESASSPIGGATPVRWRRDERALWRAGPGRVVVVLDRHDEAPRALRGRGAELWALLDRPRTVSELETLLSAEFDADPEVVRRDVEQAITQLGEAGLLRIDS